MHFASLKVAVFTGLVMANVFVSSNSHAFASFKVNQSPSKNTVNELDESSAVARYHIRLMLQPVLERKENSNLGSDNKRNTFYHHHTHGLSALQALSGYLDDEDMEIPFQQMTHRRPMISGNWKLNPSTLQEAINLLKLIAAKFENNNRASISHPDTQNQDEGVDVVIFPPFPFLATAITLLDGTGIKVGAQNVGIHTKGAFTGEVSPSMLASIGCEYVMLGHSERRTFFKETDDEINTKVKLSLAEGNNYSGRLNVILCVGETEEEYNNDLLVSVVDVQVKKGLAGVSREDMKRVTIAYEPVWAIGTGKIATPEQAQKAHVAIRKTLVKMYGNDVAYQVRILYGGSVNPDTIRTLMMMPDVDGALVGGASLSADSFSRIIDRGLIFSSSSNSR